MSKNSPARRRFRKPKAGTDVSVKREIACWLDGGQALLCCPMVPAIRCSPPQARALEDWT